MCNIYVPLYHNEISIFAGKKNYISNTKCPIIDYVQVINNCEFQTVKN